MDARFCMKNMRVILSHTPPIGEVPLVLLFIACCDFQTPLYVFGKDPCFPQPSEGDMCDPLRDMTHCLTAGSMKWPQLSDITPIIIGTSLKKGTMHVLFYEFRACMILLHALGAFHGSQKT